VALRSTPLGEGNVMKAWSESRAALCVAGMTLAATTSRPITSR
jgi:hypothetical protein